MSAISSVVRNDHYVVITLSDGNVYRRVLGYADTISSVIPASGQHRILQEYYDTATGHLMVVYEDSHDGTQHTLDIDPTGGTADHGGLTGLSDDDHSQYHNDARGDARYYKETELDAGQLDNRYYTETELGSTVEASSGASLIGLPSLDATPASLRTFIDGVSSSLYYTGGVISENSALDGTIDISEVSGAVKISTTTQAMASFTIAAASGLALSSGKNIVCIKWTTPTTTAFSVETVEPNHSTLFSIGRVYKDSNDHLHTWQGGHAFTDFPWKVHKMLKAVFGLSRATGVVATESGSAARGVAITAGSMFKGTTEFTLLSFDSGLNYNITDVTTGGAGAGVFHISGDHTSDFDHGCIIAVHSSTGNDGTYHVQTATYDSGDTETDILVEEAVSDATVDGHIHYQVFRTFYYDGDLGGGADWVETEGQHTLDNFYYNAVATGLAELISNRYGVHWIYQDMDGDVFVVYGQGNYTLAQAEDAEPPSSLPDIVNKMAMLVAKAWIQKSAATWTAVVYPWTTSFTPSGASVHNDLGGLQGGKVAEYYHLTASDYAHLVGVTSDVQTQLDGKVDESEFTAANDVLVGTGVAALVKKNPAELLAILSGDAGATFSWNDQLLSAVKGILATAPTELTLDAAGAVTCTQMFHTIDTFENAASDNLVTITNTPGLSMMVIRPADGARTIVLDHNAGNLWCFSAADVTLDDASDMALLVWDNTNSIWCVIGGGAGAGGAMATDALWDAVGDLAVGTGADTGAKLAIGSDEQVAVVATNTPGWAWPKKMRDADGDTLIQVEEGADEDKIRMDVGGTEAFLLSDAGILTLAKQAGARAYLGATQVFPSYTVGPINKFKFSTESFDIQNEYNSAQASGVATVGTTGTTLKDATLSPFVAGDVGKTVWNDTDGSSTSITAYVSTSQVTLLADINLDSTDAYTFGFSRYTATEAGLYLIIGKCRWNLVPDQKRTVIGILVNEVGVTSMDVYSSVDNSYPSPIVLDVFYLSANDYVEMQGYAIGAAFDARGTAPYETFISVLKLF